MSKHPVRKGTLSRMGQPKEETIMLAKKVTALLVSAALVLALLAGCGGSKALSQVIADLLSGLYTNVDVEVDSDLTAALKKAAAEGGTEDEILTRLVNNLNITGGSITFTRLGDGQQGDHGVDLVFQTGSDPDAAARSALAQWASVFGSLPDDGSYRAHVSMIEAENGYYIAVDVEVLKAGTPDKGETDPDPEPDPGYRVEDGAYFVTNATGLIAWANYVRAGNWDTNCTLEADIELTGSWEPIGTAQTPYTGTFDGNGKTITGLTINSSSQYVGMFGYFDGTVKDLKLENVDITSSWSNQFQSGFVGAVAGYIKSSSSITGCSVSGNIMIEGASQAGGVVGENHGSVSQCQVNELTIAGPNSGNYIYLGGVVGSNSKTVEDCQVEKLTITGGSYVGGIAGQSSSSSYAPITGCSVKNSSVTGRSSSGGVVGIFNSGEIAGCSVDGTTVATDGLAGKSGGVIGSQIGGTVMACYFANGSINGNDALTPNLGGVVGAQTGGSLIACYSTGGGDLDTSTSEYAGGMVGYKINSATVTDCYWSGDKDEGVGIPSSIIYSTHVTSEEEWTEALKGLNGSSNTSGYQFSSTMYAPSLSKKTTVIP